jgi:hypothetical protein
MLFAVGVCILFFLLELWLCGGLNVWENRWWHVLFVICSLSICAIAGLTGARNRLRGSLFADFVGETLMRVQFDERSKRILKNLSPEHSYVIGCHPHGTHCAHMIRMSGYGSALPSWLGTQLQVVVHFAYLFVPFLNVVYECCGMMPNFKFAMSNVLRNGGSLALCPEGIDGKWLATEQPSPTRSANEIDVLVRSSARLGFVSLAARHDAFLVPLLSVNEMQAYRVYPMRAVLGRFGFLPLVNRMEMRVGEPISTIGVDHKDWTQVAALATRYYEAVARLADPDFTVRLIPHVHDSPDARRKKKE